MAREKVFDGGMRIGLNPFFKFYRELQLGRIVSQFQEFLDQSQSSFL